MFCMPVADDEKEKSEVGWIKKEFMPEPEGYN